MIEREYPFHVVLPKLTGTSFVLRSLGQLVDHTFINAARSIKMVNSHGVKKIKRNIMSMQQTLRGMSQGSDEGILSLALGYWDLYEAGPKVSSSHSRIGNVAC
jgi:hypothetical protein